MKEIKTYYTGGQLQRHYYTVDGRRQGEFKWWHENGQLHIFNNYVNDLVHGECKEWYDNGQLNVLYHYHYNKLHGEYKLWHNDGELIRHAFWLYGKEVTDQVDKLVTDINDITQEERILIKLAVGC